VASILADSLVFAVLLLPLKTLGILDIPTLVAISVILRALKI
jgi:hypothetical protein